MKNIMRNISILCLFVIATVFVVPVVLAADPNPIQDGNTTGSIQVNGLESGVQATAYRLMTVNINNKQPQDPEYSWVDSVATWMKGNTTYSAWVGDNNEVTDDFNDGLTNSDDLAKFYDDLAKEIRKTGSTITGLETATATAGSDNVATITPVKMGNYLVLMENGLRVYKPLSANVVPQNIDGVWNVEDGVIETTVVTAKSSKPSIDKEVVGNQTVAIGDELTYTLTIDVPKYPEGTTNKTLNVGDVFSGGLDFVEIVSVEGDGTALTAGTNYVVTNPTTANGRTLTVDFSGTYYDTIKTYSQIVITYKAKVNSEAKVTQGNDNTATLTYNRNPYGNDKQEPSDKVIVYTYGLDLLKTGVDDDAEALAGAEFELKKGNNTLCFNKNASNTFIYTGVANNGTCTEGSTTLVSQSDGKILVNGLDTGNYTLTETKAPNDYVKLQAPKEYSIVDADLDGVEDSSTTGYVTDTIANKKGITLPITGGMGTVLFSLIGILFMGISVVLVKNILKKNEVQL